VEAMMQQESERGLREIETYRAFQDRADRVKNDLLIFLIDAKKKEKRVAAYGAAAKGNTLLNYAGIKSDLLPFICDAAPSKQAKYMPGSHIPILSPSVLDDEKLDFVLILPWNIAAEIRSNLSALKKNGVQFVTPIPHLAIQ